MNYSFLIVIAVAALGVGLPLLRGAWREADRNAEEEIRRRKGKP